jgi:hypothetical protein
VTYVGHEEDRFIDFSSIYHLASNENKNSAVSNSKLNP